MPPAAPNRSTFIVFGAHPDDIEIGMAGTICRLAAEGYDVCSCIATIPDDRVREAQEAADNAERAPVDHQLNAIPQPQVPMPHLQRVL